MKAAVSETSAVPQLILSSFIFQNRNLADGGRETPKP